MTKLSLKAKSKIVLKIALSLDNQFSTCKGYNIKTSLQQDEHILESTFVSI